MDYFLKVKNAIIQKVGPQVMGQDVGLLSLSTPSSMKPVDDFMHRYQTISQVFDNLSRVESSVEAEKTLRDSNIHEHIKEFLRHLHAEDKVWYLKSLRAISGRSSSDYPEVVNDHPCFDAFLQFRYLNGLCDRVKQDRPRGCLLLVLFLSTSILRNFHYPLLPHETIHKSIYQLIFDASSVSSNYHSLSKGKQSTTREFIGYVKKLDSHLVSLISALWNKISENPELLNFFIVVDSRNCSKRHFDAISCLIPLMGKPKVGVIAKEALLTAIRMHDSRIDSFILEGTNLKFNIITELSKKYQNCISALAASMTIMTTEPVTIGTSRSKYSHAFATGTEKSAHAMESFVKVLHFCAAVVVAATSSQDVDQSLRSEMTKLFMDELLTVIKSCVLENGEEQVLAAQSILRRLLLETYGAPKEKDEDCKECLDHGSELSSNSFIVGMAKKINPLCSVTTCFIHDDEEIVQVLIRRVGSVSRSVSVSTVQLLSSLLTVSSLEMSAQFVVGGSPIGAEVISSKYSPLIVLPSLDAFIVHYFPTSDETTISTYIEASTDLILGKLANKAINFNDFRPDDSQDFGPYFTVACQKMQVFLSSKYDEQLAVTGLVIKCVVVLLACLLNSPSEQLCFRVFRMLSMVMDATRKLDNDLASHLTIVQDATVKINVVREVLASPSTSDSLNRKILDKESHQVIRILESCVIVKELLCEVEGAVAAFRQLLFLTSDADYNLNHGSVLSTQESFMSSFLHEDVYSTDDDSVDVDIRHKSDSRSDSTGCSRVLTVDNFLKECESMEDELEGVLESFS